MEADLKVGCLIIVLDYDLQIGVWDVRGEWFGGGKASQIFRYHSHLSPGARIMATFISLRTACGFLSFLARCSDLRRATPPEYNAHAGRFPRTSS